MANEFFSKKTFIFVFFIITVMVGKTYTAEKVIDEIYYFVNDDIITKLNFEERKEKLVKNGNLSLEGNDLNVFVMSNIIFNHLMINDLKKKNTLTSQTEVDNEIQKIMNRQKIASLETFKIILARGGIDYNDFFNDIRRKLNQRVFFSKGLEQSFPSDQEIKNHYEKNKNRFLIKKPILKLSAIRTVILDGVSFSARRDFQKQLLNIRQKIEKEKIPFSVAINQFNDFRNNVLARELGWVEVQDLELGDQEASNLLNLKPGDVSPIISTSQRLEFFLVMDKISEGHLPYQLAKKKSQTELIAKTRKQAINKKIIALFKKAYLKNNKSLFEQLAKLIDNDS